MHKAKQPQTVTLTPFDITDGHNKSLWLRARQCARAGISEANCLALIEEWLSANSHSFRRAIPHMEVCQQIRRAYGNLHYPHSTGESAGAPTLFTTPSKVTESPAVVEHVQKALGDFTLEDLRREKPFPGTFSDRRPWLPARPMPALRQLWQRAIRARDASLQSYLDYTTRRTPTAIEDARREGLITPGQDPWVCVGESLAMVRTRRLSEIIDDERPQFCVPNPMAAQSGLTKDGRLSERCLGNACREDQRFFYVVEFDRCESLDEQARRLWFLSTIRPLVMVLHSGGKSLHGWFWVYGTGDFPRDGFFRMAETLGADPASRSPIQLCRTPWGIRSPKPGEDAPPKPQRVHYFNPEVIRAEVLP